MGSFQYKAIDLQLYDSYYKDNTVLLSSYLYNRNPHTWEDGLCIEKVSNMSSIPINSTRYGPPRSCV